MKIFVADLAFADNISGSGKPNGFDCTAVPADGHTQFAARDGDGNILAADLPQQSEGQDCGTGAGATGVSEILYPPFIGQFRKAIRSGDVIKVDVGAFRESGVPTESLAQLSEIIHGQIAQTGIGDGGVGQARGT